MGYKGLQDETNYSIIQKKKKYCVIKTQKMFVFFYFCYFGLMFWNKNPNQRNFDVQTGVYVAFLAFRQPENGRDHLLY